MAVIKTIIEMICRIYTSPVSVYTAHASRFEKRLTLMITFTAVNENAC